MPTVFFITHPDVHVEPAIPVPQWSLSATGRRRMERFADSLAAEAIGSIWSSRERKAVEAASILGERLAKSVQQHEGLGENDRSATGYLPRERFERMADRFFAQPEQSAGGWERAIDAQRRIVATVDTVLAGTSGGHVAIVAHGAVGTLLLCHLQGIAISRAADQPSQGHWFTFDSVDRRLLHGWRRFD